MTVAAEAETPKIDAAEFVALITSTIPMTREMPFRVVELGWGLATIELAFHERQLRAGGTLSGPTLMTLADTALYAAVLTRIGLEPLAVTSELSIHFLRKPAPAPLVATAKVLRVGRKIAVGTIEITSEGRLVAHATGSYARP